MMDKPQIILHTEKCLTHTPFDVKWIPKSAKILAIGSNPNGTGVIEIYELSDGKLNLIKSITRSKALKCATFGASRLEDRHVATGDFDGNLEVVDVTRGEDAPIFAVRAHTKIVNAIDGVAGLNVGRGAPELVTGSRDGTVKVWDPRQKDKPVVCVEPEEEGEKRDCWAVAFGDAFSAQDRCVCAGFDNGDLKLFDLRTNSIRWETNLNNGICSLQFDRKDIEMNKLVVTTLESRFSVYDMRTFHPEKGFACLDKKSHGSTVWCVSHLPQNRDVFLTTGGNGSLHLWKYVYPSKRTRELKDGSTEGVMGEIQGLNEIAFSSQPITCFDWSPDKRGLLACAGIDQSLKVGIVTKLNTL